MAVPVESIPRTIESRVSIRVPVCLPVTIEVRPLLLQVSMRSVTYNVSLDGALIEANKPDLPKGTPVRVLLETAPKVHLIADALVLRSTENGVALMFTEYADEVLEPLSAMLAAEFNKYLDSRSGHGAMTSAGHFAGSVNHRFLGFFEALGRRWYTKRATNYENRVGQGSLDAIERPR